MINKQIEGKHNLYIDILKEKQSTIENGILNANIPKKNLRKRVRGKVKK